MPNLSDAVLLAATFQPALWTSDLLAQELDTSGDDIDGAIAELRTKGWIQKRRGSPKWAGADRIRATKAGDAACTATLQRELAQG